jgi:4-amino-4-deoxy-L-arabinose transferase-like glycosyltransferase
MNDAARHHALDNSARTPWWCQWEPAALGLLVLCVYLSRLTSVPISGEESRWANGAREMIVSGDWIVPRQQGELFAERPPLSSWAMALVGLARGEVDLVAVRLPSALATLLLVWLIYAYALVWTSRSCALAAAAIYATCGQVMILGRYGESEALFTLFTAGALLAWHAAYLRRWPMTLAWMAGYALVALGALSKGLQAPVYFVGTCVVFLALRRDWRWLFSAAHLAGIATLVAIIGAWLVPFARENPHALDDIWTGLAQDRFTLDGLAGHLVAYPLETLACLLPWSALLVGWLKPSIRRGICASRPQVQFLLVAMAVTYPTVWLAAGARGRYYMPLYPCVAVWMGLIVEHCTAAGACPTDFAMWRRFLRGIALASGAGAVALVAVTLLPYQVLDPARQPWGFLALWTIAAAAAAAVALWSARSRSAPRPQVALMALAMFAGMGGAGALVNVRVRNGNDLAPAIAQLHTRLPAAGELVSLGRVYHRFAYSYELPIRQVPWPRQAGELPGDVTYFCFDRRPGDTAEDRAGNDDRLGAHTPGVLPFAWEPIAEIPCDPVRRNLPHRRVVIGRVLRTETLANQADAIRPARR